MPIPLAAIAAATPGIVKGATGAYQMIKGSGMKAERPEYETPEELKRLIKQKQAQAGGTRYPGQEQDEAELDRLQSESIRAGTEMLDDSFAVSDLVGKSLASRTKEQRQLRREGRADFERREAEKDRALLLGAQAADKEFQLNKLEPFKAKAATKSALLGAGMQNIASGITDVAGAVSAGAELSEKKKAGTGGGGIGGVKSPQQVTDLVTPETDFYSGEGPPEDVLRSQWMAEGKPGSFSDWKRKRGY